MSFPFGLYECPNCKETFQSDVPFETIRCPHCDVEMKRELVPVTPKTEIKKFPERPETYE